MWFFLTQGLTSSLKLNLFPRYLGDLLHFFELMVDFQVLSLGTLVI